MQREVTAGGIASIRPAILRQYYETTFGSDALPREAFAGATFEEYLELMRFTFPGITRYRAALRSHGGIFKHLAEGFKAEETEADPPRSETRMQEAGQGETLEFRNLPLLGLRKALKGKAPGALVIDRVKNVMGLTALGALKDLKRMRLLFCGTDGEITGIPGFAVEDLELTECAQAILEGVLPAAKSKRLRITHLDSATLDFNLIQGYRKLRRLVVDYGFVLGIGHLRGCPMEEAFLPDLAVDEEFFATLGSWKKTLRLLHASPRQPFGPDSLPDLPHLREMEIPGHLELRKPWVDFAMARTEVRFTFSSLPGAPDKAPFAKVGEVHRGYAILEFSKGSKRWYEIAADFTERAKGAKDRDNHDLRDRLESWAKTGKLKAEFSSEAAQLVIRAPKAETVKACIDALLSGHDLPRS